ncbi:hypothetical protein [Acetobacter indonesiensis]|uniref:hypothetical protein n=1 Tax=Acetobacter indonesiensis TaxID=104101 RepID=UPI0020A5A409|nr:hypothetical protein [Acetobacter indonesiensis]MCP1232028.1 hypothetical protein [Acetobacter indonesiensis]
MCDDLGKPKDSTLSIAGDNWRRYVIWSGADTGYDRFAIGHHDIARPLGARPAIP